MKARLAAIALMALATTSPAAAQPSTQIITLDSYRFSPEPIHLKAGQPVTLNFINRSGKGHDFTARSFFANSRITGGSAPNGEIELKGHQSKTVTLVPRAGTYGVHCSHFLHSSFGMKAQIIVD